MRFVAFIFFLLVSVMALSQQNITAKTITLSQYMKLRGVRVDSISIDGTFSTPSHFTLPTTRAVYDFIQALNVIPDWSDITNIPAGFADGIDNVDDADNSPTNELQSLSIAGDSLGISGGNKVRIPTADSLSQLVNDAGYITKSLYTDSDTLPTGRTAYVQDTFQFVLDAFLTTIKVGAQYNVYDVNFWGSDFKSWGTYYEGISGQGFSGTDGYSFIRDARNEENTSHEYFGAGTVERYVSNGDETVTEGIAADEYSLSATNGTNTGSLSVTGNVTELVTTSTGTSEISRVQSLGNGAMLSTTQGTQVGRVYAERDHIQSAIIVDGTPIVAIEHEIGDTSITVHNESGKGMEYDEEPSDPSSLTLATVGFVNAKLNSDRNKIKLVDDFISGTTEAGEIGELGWSTGGSLATIAPTDNHPGIAASVSTTTASSYHYLGIGTATARFLPNNVDSIIYIFYVTTTTAVTYHAGMGSGITTNIPASFIGVRFNSAVGSNWTYFTRSGSIDVASADSGVAVVANTWYTFKAIRTATDTWSMSITGGSPTSISATGLSSTGMIPSFLVQPTTAGTKTIAVDYFEIDFTVNR